MGTEEWLVGNGRWWTGNCSGGLEPRTLGRCWTIGDRFPGVQRTASGSPVRAERRQGAPRGDRQREEFIHDSQNECDPVDNAELVVEAIDVRVDGVRRDGEVDGDGELGVIVKNAAQDLEFAWR